MVTTLSEGTSVITATAGAISKTVTITVTAPVLVSLSITPAATTTQIGDASEEAFRAIAHYTNRDIDVTNQAAWSVGNPFISSMEEAGSVRSLRPGFTRISAAFESMNAAATLTILAQPRYLYKVSDAGRLISRLTVDPATGQARYAGNVPSDALQGIGMPCLSMDPSNGYAYLSVQPDMTIGYVYPFYVSAPTGFLASFVAPIDAPSPVGCIQFEPRGNFGYSIPAFNESEHEIVIFSKDAYGNLAAVDSFGFPEIVDGLTVDPLGKFLYLVGEAFYGTDPAKLYGYTIDASTGSLLPVEGMPLPLPVGTYGYLSIHPSGEYLYLANFNSDVITTFSIDRESGLLSNVGHPVHTCINPSAPQFSPDGSMGFSVCSMDSAHDVNSSALVSLRIGNDGQLTEVGRTPSELLQNLVVDPSGSFVYGDSWTHLAVYQIHEDGTTTLLSRTMDRTNQSNFLVLSGAIPVTYTTEYAYAVTREDHNLMSFAVGGDGTLRVLAAESTLSSPFLLAKLPWGPEFLVAGDGSSPNLRMYGIDESSGALTAETTLTGVASPGGAVMDPSGEVALVSDSSSQKLYRFSRISPGFVPNTWYGDGTVFDAGPGAGPLAFDPAGRTVFVANRDANNISQYEPAGAAPVDPYAVPASLIAICAGPTGDRVFYVSADNRLHVLDVLVGDAISELDSVSLPGAPTSVVTDPTGRYVYVGTTAGLSAFRIDGSSGALSAVSLSSAAAVTDVAGIFVEPAGQYLYASTHTATANSLWLFKIEADGTLTGDETPLIQTPGTIVSMAFHARIE